MFPWPSFLLYTFATTITPGPNNIMSMSLGLRYGFFKTLYFSAGVIMGFITINLIAVFLCATLNAMIPALLLPMKISGTVYLIWLAWKVFRSTYSTEAKPVQPQGLFFSGLVLQFVNAKTILSSLVSFQVFVLPHYQDPWILAAFAVFIACAGVSANLVWCAFGSAASMIFNRYTRLINSVLALSLIFCAVGLWL